MCSFCVIVISNIIYGDTEYIWAQTTTLMDPFCLRCTAGYLGFSTLHRILYPDTLFYIFNFVLTHIFIILNHKPPLMESHPFSDMQNSHVICLLFFLKYLLTHVLIKMYYLLSFFSLINLALNKVSFYDAAAILLAQKLLLLNLFS
jgi:hypothetical protein